MNQFHLLLGYGYRPSQQPISVPPQFYHHSPFNITHSLQPITNTLQGYPGNVPAWQEYDLHQGSYTRSQKFPHPQFSAQWLSSVGTPRVPPAQPRNNPVILPASSSSTPPPGPRSAAPGPSSNAHVRPPISHPTKIFQLAVELRNTTITGILDIPPLLANSCDKCEAEDETEDSSNLGGANAKAQTSPPQTILSLKQFAKKIWQPNFGVFNIWMKEWAGRYLHSKQQRFNWGVNGLTSFLIDPCTGRCELEISYGHLSTGCYRKMLITLIESSAHRLVCLSGNVKVIVGRVKKRKIIKQATGDGFGRVHRHQGMW